MKRITFLPLVIVLILGLAISACGPKQASETPENESGTSAASETPVKNEVIKMTLAYGSKAPQEGRYTYTQELHLWAQKIEEESDGRVHIDIYPAETLLEYENIFKGVVNRQADIGLWSPHYGLSEFPVSSVFELPGVPWGTYEQTYTVLHELYDEFPELQAEYEGTKPLFFTSQPSSMLAIAKDVVVHTPSDVKGMKLASSDVLADLIKEIGATPVSIPGADRYLAIDRGMVDGTEIVWGGVLAFQLFDVCKTFTENVGFGQPCSVVIMNQKTWDSLPSDIQDIFDSLNKPTSLAMLKGYATEGDTAREATRNAGRTIYSPTTDEYKLWTEAFSPMRDKWVQEREAEGLPGKEVADELFKLAEEYSK
jgi:TRAP-type C4-dicarboxylate transport system substrate-binding protein